MIAKKPKSVEEYISQFPAEVQARLKKVRATIRKTAPKAVEGISYGIAGYKLDGKALIYFSAAKAHIGIYPRRDYEKRTRSICKRRRDTAISA